MSEKGKSPPFMSEGRIQRLFLSMDKQNTGFVEHGKLAGLYKETLKQKDEESSSLQKRRLRQYLILDLIKHCEEKSKDRISYEEFKAFIRGKEKQLWDFFCEIDATGDGVLGPSDLELALKKAGVSVSKQELKAFIFHMDADKDGITTYILNKHPVVGSKCPNKYLGLIRFQEWSNFLLFSPKNTSIRNIYMFYLNIVHQSDSGDPLFLPEGSESQMATFKYLIAGGCAGAISRSVTAPLDRIRVLLMCQEGVNISFRNFLPQTASLFRQIYADGGISAFWRGNGVNVLKIFPESAIRFYIFESCKRILTSGQYGSASQQQQNLTPGAKREVQIKSDDISTTNRMISGGIAGFVSQIFIYPLETIKTRMMANIQSEALTYSISATATARQILTHDGYRGYFRGLGPSLIGIIPYASIDLTAYETLKNTYAQVTGNKPTAPVHLMCGAAAGALAATIVYPLGFIRTRLQAQGTTWHKQHYERGALDVIVKTYKKESFRGFYKGLFPTLMKVIPSVSISYICYEQAKIQLGIA